MNVNIKLLHGKWDLGYSLDKHSISSVPIGPNEWGHMQFDTKRSEIGEALFRLKYRSDYTQVDVIAIQMHQSLSGYFSLADFILPMPFSIRRKRQPVFEIARKFSRLMNIPCYESLLVKNVNTPPMKDIPNREEKIKTLMNAFMINDQLNEGLYDVIIVDDLYDTGSSLEAASNILRQYHKIGKIYVATVTRRR